MIVVESATLLYVALRVIGFHLRRHCSAQVLEADIHDFSSKSSVE